MTKYHPCSLKVTSTVYATPGPCSGISWENASWLGRGWCQGLASNQTGWTANSHFGFAAQWLHLPTATSEPGHCSSVFTPQSPSFACHLSRLLPVPRADGLSLTALHITFHHWGQGQDPPSNTMVYKLEGCCWVMLSLDNITRWPASFPGPSIKIQLSANPQQLHRFAFVPSTTLSLMACLLALSDCTVEQPDYSSHP